MKKIVTSFCCFIYLFCPCAPLSGAQIQLVMVGDTSSDIGITIVPDLVNMHKQIGKIAQILDIEIHEKVFTGSSVQSEFFFQELNTIESAPDDIFIFFFSGHGYRTKNKDAINQWPNLFFSVEKNGVDFEDIVNIIKEKNPRLILAMADSCNNYIPQWLYPVIKPKKKLARMLVLPEINAHLLFMAPKGEILISAASPSELAWATDEGGIFSNSFHYTLSKAIEGGIPPDWAQILVRASEAVEGKQTPQYHLNIDY